MNVLVVLVNFNSPQDTYRCLESLAKSTLRPEVVVVDNASTGDGVIDEMKAKACHADTHVIFNLHNDGFGGGNNIGLEWGLENRSADYFFILNNDTVVLPDTIEKLVNYLELNQEIGMCSPAIMHFKTPDVYWFGGGYIDWSKGGAISPNINKNIASAVPVLDNTFITGCAMFVRRSVLETVGGFSEDYFMYCEDVDLCERALRVGYRIGYVSEAKILHDAHASLVKDRAAYMPPFSWKNKSASFFVKHYVYGALLNLKKYAHGMQHITGVAHVMKMCIKWGGGYLIHARFDGLNAIAAGVYCYLLGKRPA
ncbi:MAG: glycosyltransferase family 2 protein [Gammaproteobacteria bacterium]|nr:glycosyltransferase family 2 protein [Gammaproteobacteria bacterium]MBU1446708.1 glycosyltransferase family 2 protein [Gammaproteobacteria bacterium]